MPIQDLKQQLIENPSLKSKFTTPVTMQYQVGLDSSALYAKPDPLYNDYLTQTNWNSFGNALERGVVKFALSVPEQAGYLWGFADGTKDYDNAVSAWARGWKEQVDTTFPEYSRLYENGFNPGDADWWWRNGDSIVESAGYMFTGAMVGKGVMAGLGALGATANTAKIAATLTSAVAMNYAEGMQMAGARYRQLLDEGVSKELASKAASEIVKKNGFLLPMQIAESYLLLKGLAGTRSMSAIGFKASAKDALKQIGQEGFEEWAQGFIEEEAVRKAEIGAGKKVDDGSSFTKRLSKYALSDDALTQALIGGIGGGAMQVSNDIAMNLDPKYKEQKQKAYDQISKNYSELIDTASKVAELQKKKDFAARENDPIAFDHATREQAFAVAVKNARLGTYDQFMRTFESFSEMTEEEAQGKGLNKADISKMVAALKPVFNSVEKVYGRTEANLGKKVGPEYVESLVQQAFYADLHRETAAAYNKEAGKKLASVSFESATHRKLNELSNRYTALTELIDKAKNTLKQAPSDDRAKAVLSKAEKALNETATAITEEEDRAKELYPGKEINYAAPMKDLEIQQDIHKAVEHEFLSEYHAEAYKEYSSKKKIEELKKEAEAKVEVEENKIDEIAKPLIDLINTVNKTGDFAVGAKEKAKTDLANKFESLKQTDAYKNATPAKQKQIEAKYKSALARIASAKEKTEEEADEESKKGLEEKKTKAQEKSNTKESEEHKANQEEINSRKKYEIISFGYLGQAYSIRENKKGELVYEDEVDEDGNPILLPLADPALADYASFKVGDSIEIVLDRELAAKQGIEITEENLYRIPFGIRRPGQPITAWVHAFDAPVGTEIDSKIKKLIPRDLREEAQKDLLEFRKMLFANRDSVLKTEVNSKSTGYALKTEARPALQQIAIEGKVADDVDFAIVENGVVKAFGTDLSISTEGRRDDEGRLMFPEGALIVAVPSFTLDRENNPILEPYFANSTQLEEGDVEVIMHAITKGKPKDAWEGTGIQANSLEQFLNYFVYNGNNSGNINVSLEKEGNISSRYIYRIMTAKGVWDKRSRIRVWTNDNANPVTQEELEEAKEALRDLYYNFPKGIKSYPKVQLVDGNVKLVEALGYKEHIASKVTTVIHGKQIPGSNRMQFFAQPIVGIAQPNNQVLTEAVPAKKKKASTIGAKVTTTDNSLEAKRNIVRAALKKAGQGEGGQFKVTLVDGTEENAVRIGITGDELFVGNKGSMVDIALITKIENPDGKVVYNSESSVLEAKTTVANSTPIKSFSEPILNIRSEVTNAVKQDPTLTYYTLRDALPQHSEAIKKAFSSYKKSNPAGDVSTFIKDLVKEYKSFDALTVTTPLTQRNTTNTRLLKQVTADKMAVYSLLTESSDEQFNSDMRNLLSLIDDFGIVTVEGSSPYLALANSSENRIYMFGDNVSRTNRPLHTILAHEVIHLATAQAIVNPQSEAEKEFSKNINAAYLKAKKSLGEVAGENAKEFIAEFYANKEFRNKLNSVEEGLLQKIINWIKELFGFSSPSFEETIREYTNTFVRNFKGYNRNFAPTESDPLYAEYVDNGISLSRREMLVSSLSGETLKRMAMGTLDMETLKYGIRQSIEEAKEFATEEGVEVLNNLSSNEALMEVLFNDVKNQILRLDVGYDERENWQVDSRFEVNPWSTTSKQVRKFLAAVPEQAWEDGELIDVTNELGFTVYKNPIALHANLAETLSGKNVMAHLSYLAGYNRDGIVYDPVKRYIYETLLAFKNSNDAEQLQTLNAFKTDFKKYKAEFVSAKHKEESQIIGEGDEVQVASTYSFDLYDSNRTGTQAIVSQWYNSFNNKMTNDGIVDTDKTKKIYSRFNLLNDPKNLDANALHAVLMDFGINLSVNAIQLAITAPSKVVKRMTTQKFLQAINNIIRTSTTEGKAEVFGVNHPFIRNEESNIKLLAKFEAQVNSSSFSSLFRTESGKNMYAVSNNTMLFETEQKIKEEGPNGLFMERLRTDVYSRNSLLVHEITAGEEFDIKIFSEFVNLKKEPAALRELTVQERRLAKMAAFNNRGAKTALIQFPTIEAKPVVPFLKVNKIPVTVENGKIDNKTTELMFNIVKSEFDRIVRVREEQKSLKPEDLIEVYHFQGRDVNGNPKFNNAQGLKFHMTPIMNTFEVEGVKVKDMQQAEFELYAPAIKERLKDFANEIINREWSALSKLGIAKTVKDSLRISPQFWDSKAARALGTFIHGDRAATQEEFVANYVLNYYIRYADILQVFAWDMAFTKGHIDMSKRLAAIIAPGNNLDIIAEEDASKEIMQLMVIKDEFRTSPMIHNWNKVIEYLNEKYKGKLNIDAKEALQGLINQNTTDGQTLVGINYKRDELDSLGRLNEETSELLDAAEYGEDVAPTNMPVGSSKIVYTNKVWDGEKFVFVYIKTSTNTVIPGVHRDDLVDLTNRADIVSYASSVKAGAQGIGTGVTHDITREGLRLQQELTYHGDDTSITALSQARRMLTEGLRDSVFKNLRFNFDGKNLDVMSFRNQFQQLHIAGVVSEWKKLSDSLGVKLDIVDGKPEYYITDMAKLREYLINDGRLTDTEIELLDIKGNSFSIPLYFSPANERFESIMFSIISKKIMSIEQEGSSFVQVAPNVFKDINNRKVFSDKELSEDALNQVEFLDAATKQAIKEGNFGLRDMYFDEATKSMKPAQILLPNTFKKYFLNKKEVTIEDLRKAGISEFFLMRSPYQLASGFPAEIVGFLPQSMGEIVVVPHEAMDRIGYDFDVDKLYAYLSSAEFTPNGASRIEYTTSEDKLDYRYRQYVKEKIFGMLDNNESLEEEKEGLIKEFKNTVDSIVEARVRKEMPQLEEAAKEVQSAIDALPVEVKATVQGIFNARGYKAIFDISSMVSEYTKRGDLKSIAAIKPLQKVEAELGNYQFVSGLADNKFSEYKELIRNSNGYDDLKKNLKYEIKERLTDFAIESGMTGENLMSKEEFAALPIEEQNSKKARNNAILDMFMEVYKHPEIMYKLLTSNSEKPVQDAVARAERKIEVSSPLTIEEQDRLFSVNRDSKTGIAISSTWVTFQEVLQNNKVKLKVWEDVEGKPEVVNAGVKFLNEKGNLLIDENFNNDESAKEAAKRLPKEYEGIGMYAFKTRGITQDLTAKYMLIIQTATVDNIKNQTMSPANLNDYTLATAMYLGAMGIDNMDIVVRFLTQPVVLEYSTLRDSGLSHANSVKKLYSQLSKKVISLKGKPVRTESEATRIKAFSSEQLLDLIRKNNREEKDVNFYNDQLEILNKWDIYTNNATTIGVAASDANFDTSKLGKNFHEVKKRADGYERIRNNKDFVNLDKIFSNNVIGAYYNYGVIPAHTMFNHADLLPYGYLLYNRVYSSYSKNVAENNGRLDDKTRRELNKNILAFVASYENSISSPKDRQRLLELPKRVSALKEEYPDNLLLSRIDIELARHLGKKYYSMQFRRIGLDPSEIKYMVASFTELLDNPATREIAEDMIRYTLVFKGISQSRDSLITVIPPAYLLSSNYGDVYKSGEFKSAMNSANTAQDFFDQYAAHNPTKLKYHSVTKWNGTHFVYEEEGEESLPDYVQVQYKGKTYAATRIASNLTESEFAILNPLGADGMMEYSFSLEDSVLNPIVTYDFSPTIALTQFTEEITGDWLMQQMEPMEEGKQLELFSEVKKGVSELFESNPKLANKVYEALGFGQESDLSEKSIFTVEPIQSVDKKAKSKAKIATQYIGFAEGIVGSSTALYAKQISEQSTKKVSAKGKMTFSYDSNKRSDVNSNTTFEAIKNGERTATTRYESDGHIDYWKNLKAGDVIEWESTTGEKIKVEVTKPLHKLVGSNKTAEQWSKLEGWSVEYFNSKVKPKLNEAWQIEYKPIQANIVNSGNYSSNDVIFVSVSGKRGNEVIRKQQQDKTIKAAIKALEAGATLITDNAAYVESNSYNEGEKRLSANLKAKGYVYSETTVDGNVLGVWNKANTEITPEQKQEAQSKFQEYVDATGRQDIEGFKEFVSNENNTQNVQYQLPQGREMEEFVASEKTIRDLAARISDRIGIPVRFESDRTKDYKGKLENGTAVVNLAYATLDTPIHEILGHPIIRAIKGGYNKASGNKYINSEIEITKKLLNKEITREEATELRKQRDTIEGNKTLYQNLLKELETGYGKEVLDRVKEEYNYKENIPYMTALENRHRTLYWDEKTKTGYIHDNENPNQERIRFNSEKEVRDYLKLNDKYTLEEQQEEALVQLLGELTAGKIKETKENKNLISLLKQLLKQMTEYMRSLFNSKEIEIDKLRADMTLNDLANLLAYTNSKIILPGSRVEYTTPDNQKFATYQEASRHISKLFNESKDVDLSNVKIELRKKVNNSNEIPVNKFIDEFDNTTFIKKENIWYELSNNVPIKEENIVAIWNSNISDNNQSKSGIEGFLQSNKQFEQSKEIIEEWKKVNNIQYNPEEVYSRGQGFYSAIGAYSSLELDLLLQNLLQHIEDNKKAGGEFNISAFTAPVGKTLKHLGGESQVRFVIYPKSEDIKWAAPTDVYSGSVWDAAEKVSKDKKSELLGVSHTKYPSLNNINEVSPNLASIIDERSHHHNELGIELTPTNFRLEYDETVPYEIKKLVNSVNSILDQRYGKSVKPEISVSKDISEFIEDNDSGWIADGDSKWKSFEFNGDKYTKTYELEFDGENRYIYRKNGKKIYRSEFDKYAKLNANKSIQPTQTKENTTSIESVKTKLDSREKVLPNKFVFKGKYTGYSSDTWYYKKDGEWYMKYVPFDAPFNTEVESYDITKMSDVGLGIDEIWDSYLKSNPEGIEDIDIEEKKYTEQALINTKIAKLKEVAKKYPRSLIRSEVRPINSNSDLGFTREALLFQKIASKQDIEGFKKFMGEETLDKSQAEQFIDENFKAGAITEAEKKQLEALLKEATTEEQLGEIIKRLC